MKKILSLDFDGVLHSYTSGWLGARTIPDPPVKGAIVFLDKAIKHFEVHIYSSRSHYWFGRRAMRKWLWTELCAHFEMPLNRNHPWHNTPDGCRCCTIDLGVKWPQKKPPAHLMIDDRAFAFRGNFPSIKEVLEFKPWRTPTPRAVDSVVETGEIRIEEGKRP